MRTRFHQAFTLLEVLVSVGIFLLLAGGIFSAIRAGLGAAQEVTSLQLDLARLEGFERFGRHLFHNLPANTHLELRMRQWEGRGNVPELWIWPVSRSSALMLSSTTQASGIVLGAVPDRNSSGFQLALAFFDASQPPAEISRSLRSGAWITLVPGIQALRWRFIPADDTRFVEVWEGGRPALADLNLTRADGTTVSWQFSVPAVQPASLAGGQP